MLPDTDHIGGDPQVPAAAVRKPQPNEKSISSAEVFEPPLRSSVVLRWPDWLNRWQRRNGILLFWIGCALMVLGGLFMVLHATRFASQKEQALAVGMALPDLSSRTTLLKATIDAEQAYGAAENPSREERATAYILPDQPDTSRLTRAIQDIAQTLGAIDGRLDVKSVTFAPASVPVSDHQELQATLKLSGTFARVARLLSILEWGSALSVRDALPPPVTQNFLRKVELASPLSLASTLKFLFLDLTSYAASPDQAEDQLKQDMPQSLATDVRLSLLQSGLNDVRTVLSPVASSLIDKHDWPLPIVRVLSIDGNAKDGWEVRIGIVAK